ncbi:sensor histidine kinase [Cohnella boryungensis]|uniref:sensor histidine kinase n=1 Tax=Cohnella boryungensis TaxID=768479 RepID=UPI001956BA69
MPGILQYPRINRLFILICLALFLGAASYIQFHSLTNPSPGILVERNSSSEWIVAGILQDSIASGLSIEPGDRIVSFDGRPDPRLFVSDNEKILTGANRLEVVGSEGRQYSIAIKPTRTDKLENGFAFLMEAFLVGVGWYSVRKNPESRLFRRFFLLNVIIAFCIVAMFSDEIYLSNYIFVYCAIWLPYVILSFYLLFAFRSIYSRFRPLLLGYQAYSAAFSAFATFSIVRQITYSWVTDALNVALIITLILIACITAFYWSKFDRIERNQLFILFLGVFTSLMPYVLLYAIPRLLWADYFVSAEYTLIGLVPISGTLTYLLVQRQMLDWKFYVPRIVLSTFYCGFALALFLLAAAWGSALYAAGLCILFGLLTYGYRRLLLRLLRHKNRNKEWLEHQKLRMSLQLAEKNNIRDILKLFADLLHDRIEVQGLTLVYFDDNVLPLVYKTGIYEDKFGPGVASAPDNQDWSNSKEYAQVMELLHGQEDQKLGYLCLGPKTNRSPFSSEEIGIIGKLREEVIHMLSNARQLVRARYEYELNKDQIDLQERQFHDFRTYNQLLLEAREAEKIRISYFLHDDLLQNLIFLSRDLEELHDTGRYERERNATWLKCLYDSQRSIRSLSDHLYPHILDKGDLQEALQWLLRDMNRQNEIAVALHYEAPSPEPFPAFVKANLFRAVRELIVNVFKHAQASEMHVRVWMNRDYVFCSVMDNGKGFTTASPSGKSAAGGSRFGLLSVCDQMEHMGGTADIDSVPGQGTSVTLKLPLC